ncbi:hypothetical protein Cgig2_006451 [Carnegiea gigantea]|uniref:Zinc finger GRF-type domain-containing protein n=1 Tax=Carnegiea gigantea TaxID=171969 RepID=A0A9Q1QD56_9CARY|nr:hypothetical protein Cgig2_006451 [Carnegiea gigantea]
MSSSAGQSPANACKSYPYFSNCVKFCDCRKRCEIMTSMTKKNQLRRFARCPRFEMHGGRGHLEWIDDSFCDKVRSMVVALMVNNKSLFHEIKALQKIKKEREVEKQEMKALKEKSVMLKVKVRGYQMRERLTMSCLLFFVHVIVVAIGVGGGDKTVVENRKRKTKFASNMKKKSPFLS